jgi:hypothetical protein
VLPKPQPFRDHPYWIGAIAAHRREVWRKRHKANPLYVPSEAPTTRTSYHDLLFKIREVFFGRAMDVRPWHPRWPDYGMVVNLAKRFITNKKGGRSLVLSSTPGLFEGWLLTQGRESDSIGIHRLLELDATHYGMLKGRYDGCVLILTDVELLGIKRILKRVGPLLSEGDFISVCVLNGQGLMVGQQFNQYLLRESTGFFDRCLAFEEVHFVSAGRLGWTALRSVRSMFMLMMRNPFFLIPSVLPMMFLLLVSLVSNLVGRRVGTHPANGAMCSSMHTVLRVMSESFDAPARGDFNEIEIAGKRFEAHHAPLFANIRAKSV